MITRTVMAILAGPPSEGAERLHALVDEFRAGRAIDDLVPLLDAEDHEVVAIGAWVLGELPVTTYRVPAIVSRLQRLAEHPAAPVRMEAFGALVPLVDWQHPDWRVLLDKLRNDANEGVRQGALAFSKIETPDAI